MVGVLIIKIEVVFFCINLEIFVFVFCKRVDYIICKVGIGSFFGKIDKLIMVFVKVVDVVVVGFNLKVVLIINKEWLDGFVW